MENLIQSIKEANLVGRGGAEFPAWRKWEAVRSAEGRPKYVVCNASEREPNVFKDFFILSHHLDKVFKAMELAMEAVGAKEGIFNLNDEYGKKLRGAFEAEIAASKARGFAIRIFDEDPSYIGGEETALLNAMERKRCEPRLKPPFPTEAGLNGRPTLIHNVETLFDICLVSEGKYDGKRFFSVSGAVKNEGVFRLSSNSTILQVLTESKNVPKADWFIQAGGGASGIVLNAEQAGKQVCGGAGAIIVHLVKEDPRKLLLEWLTFYQAESCGKCTPCREGTYQLLSMVQQSKKTIPWDRMEPILESLEQTSFCALGRGVAVPVRSYRQNVLDISVSSPAPLPSRPAPARRGGKSLK